MYQFSEHQDLQFDQKHNLKHFLVNNGFQGKVQMTRSYCSILRKSQRNFQSQTKAILLFILRILAPNYYNQIWNEIIKWDSEEITESYEIDGKFGFIMNDIADAYMNANH